jgi:hypothetical protein
MYHLHALLRLRMSGAVPPHVWQQFDRAVLIIAMCALPYQCHLQWKLTLCNTSFLTRSVQLIFTAISHTIDPADLRRHFSRDRSSWSSPFFSSTTFQNVHSSSLKLFSPVFPKKKAVDCTTQHFMLIEPKPFSISVLSVTVLNRFRPAYLFQKVVVSLRCNQALPAKTLCSQNVQSPDCCYL